MSLATRFHSDPEKALHMQAAVMRETQLNCVTHCPGYIQVRHLGKSHTMESSVALFFYSEQTFEYESLSHVKNFIDVKR